MELEKVFKLLDAGFTKEDILKFDSVNAELAKPVEKVADVPVTAAPEPKAEEPSKPVEDKNYVDIMNGLRELTNAIYLSNIHNSNVGQQKAETSDDILASIINPKR